MKTFLDFLSEGVNDPAIFKAVFLAGGPGSGKSFIVGKTALSLTFALNIIQNSSLPVIFFSLEIFSIQIKI